MKVFIVYAHQETKSFNGALLETALNTLEGAGHQVEVSRLYEMGWNPVSDRRNFTSVKDPGYFKQQIEELHACENNGFAPDIEAEYLKLKESDVLIFQCPLWWFGLPAILKGWVDRVFAMGRVYGGGKWYDRGVFSGRRAMLAMTTGGPESMYEADGLNGHMEQILFPINHGIFAFTGYSVLPPFVAYAVAHVSPEKRAEYLAAYRQRLLTIETTRTLVYPLLADYDEQFRLRK